jgi:cytochrome c-type biogenesis protein CcmH/NrfG
MRDRKTIYVTREVPVDNSTNMLLGFVAGIVYGALGGYVVGTQAASGPFAMVPAATASVSAVAPLAAPAAPAVNEADLQAYRNILANDPKNVQALIELANRLYDAQRWADAIPYYQQAFALRPDPNVSTDLGTSLWNAGRTDDALAQFERSLKIDAKHSQTLFNIGIVRLNGKADPAGAIAAWERLLTSDPNYPEHARVRQLIADAKARIKPIAATPRTER